MHLIAAIRGAKNANIHSAVITFCPLLDMGLTLRCEAGSKAVSYGRPIGFASHTQDLTSSRSPGGMIGHASCEAA